MLVGDDTESLPAESSPRPSPPAASHDAGGPFVEIAPGDCLGRYTIRARLGGGGMGEVFAADDPELGRVVALKVLRPDRSDESSEARLRFQREAQAMARLSHPNVVAVYDVGAHGERAFIAMELVSGPTLATWLAERPRGWREVLAVFAQAGHGLAAAHEAGLVHRDFKPSNVLIGDRVRVADFGLARAALDAPEPPARSATPLDGVVTRAGDTPGTPAYMAPEQRAGLAAGRLADQYAFAVALHEALLGARPGQPAAAAAARAIPAWLRALLERALRERPEDRYPSMRELLADLERRPARARRGWLVAAAGVAAAVALAGVIGARDPLPENPLASARFTTVADFEGTERSATISRAGDLVAFLSDHDGPIDIWLTRVGGGELQNLTRGGLAELVNPEIRTLQFSPDGRFVWCWRRRPDLAGASDISIWAVPVAGGPPAVHLVGAVEADTSADGARLVYHTAEPGDPLYLKDAADPAGRRIFAAAPGIHGHYPTWSADGASIFLVMGVPPDKMDLWRLPASGGTPERLTFHGSRVSDPTPLGARTLLYLATADDGSGPWLHGLDLERRASRRLVPGIDQYTSLAASAGGRRLVATVARPKASLWRVPISHETVDLSAASRIALPTPGGRSPRAGAGSLYYVSSAGDRDAVWKVGGKESVEVWSGRRERIIGGPAISRDGRLIAFITEQEGGGRRLRVMREDGAQPREVASGLELAGGLAFTPGGDAVTVGAFERGAPRLYDVPLGGGPPAPLVSGYSTDPTWSPDGTRLLYTAEQSGITVAIEAVTPDGRPASIPRLAITRGARRLAFVPGGHGLVVLRGDTEHKDFWLVDLETGAERRLTQLGRAVVRDFDVSADGREIVFDRVIENSDVVLIEPR
jgi:Tol biopolymer transport system component